jgi:hypothetical protein
MPRATRAFAQYFFKVESVRTGNTGPLGWGPSSFSRRRASGESGMACSEPLLAVEPPVAPVELPPAENPQHPTADAHVGAELGLDPNGLAE